MGDCGGERRGGGGYVCDLDTSVYGSGFPCNVNLSPYMLDLDVWREYYSSTWNLNNLSKLLGSVLCAFHDHIAGIMIPWLYIWVLFHSFCWYAEVHCFYPTNYMHLYVHSITNLYTFRQLIFLNNDINLNLIWLRRLRLSFEDDSFENLEHDSNMTKDYNF